MAYDFDGVDDRLTYTPVSFGYPASMATWAKADATTANMSLQNVTSPTAAFRNYLVSAVLAASREDVCSTSATSLASCMDRDWDAFVGTFRQNATSLCTRSGGTVVSNTGGVACGNVVNANLGAVGANVASGPVYSQFLDGKVAEVVTFQIELSAAEMRLLSRCHYFMLPGQLKNVKVAQSLISRLNGGPFGYRGPTLSASGAVATTAHPPIVRHSPHMLMAA